MATIPKYVSSFTEREKWKSITPPLAVKWENIEVSKTYAIPPIDGHRRRKIRVLEKGVYWFKYTENLKETKQTDTDIIYKSDIAASFIFKF